MTRYRPRREPGPQVNLKQRAAQPHGLRLPHPFRPHAHSPSSRAPGPGSCTPVLHGSARRCARAHEGARFGRAAAAPRWCGRTSRADRRGGASDPFVTARPSRRRRSPAGVAGARRAGAAAGAGGRADLRVARRQRHAGAVGPRARHADEDLRSAGCAGLPDDDRRTRRPRRRRASTTSSWRTRSGTRCGPSWCGPSSRWSPATTRWRRRRRARWG